MDQSSDDPILSSTLLAEIEAVAVLESRSSRDLLQEIVERFLQDRRENGSAEVKSTLSPKEAARLMLERRPFNKLPEGMTIREMMTYGRM